MYLVLQYLCEEIVKIYYTALGCYPSCAEVFACYTLNTCGFLTLENISKIMKFARFIIMTNWVIMKINFPKFIT